MRVIGRVLRPFALVAMVLMCASCVSIPDSSPVSQAENVNVDDRFLPFSNDVPGPQPGAARAEIVNGFFQAMLAYPQSSAVAREFLTPAAAVSWDPRVSTVVYTDLGVITESGDVVSVPVAELGRLNARGAWTTAPADATTVTSQLRLEQVDGEWRISNPAPGTFIDVDYFNRNYGVDAARPDPSSLYFIDPTQSVLTPDPVHVVLGETTATALVSNLLLGPSPELAGVATNGAPAGTKLEAAVSVSDVGLAEIPLNAEFLKSSEQDRAWFAKQLAWTLRQVPNIRTIAITVDGAAVSIEGVAGEFGVEAFAGFDPADLAADRRLYALARTGLVAVEDAEVTAIAGPASQVRAARSVAVDPDGALAAFVAAGGRSAVVAGMASTSEQTPVTWIDDATSLLKPSWDQHGVLWAVDRTSGNAGARLLAATGDKVAPIRAPGLTGKDVAAIAVSSDGIRLAAIVRDGDTPRLTVSVIDRDAQDPAKVSLRPARTVRPAQFTLRTMTALAWVSPTTVAVLGTVGSGDAQPYALAIDGSAIEASSGLLPAVPTTLAAGANEGAPMAFGDAEGRLFVQTPDFRWAQAGGDVALRAPVYPG